MTTAPTPSRADALIREHRASMHPETLRAWASDAVDELGRLQASYQALQTENERLRMELVAEASAAAEQKLRADQLAQQHRMQAQMHAQATRELAEEVDCAGNWRRLALQFDGHRMQALGHLRTLLASPEAHRAAASEFLAAPPLSGEAVLAQRLAELEARKPLPLSDEQIDAIADGMPGGLGGFLKTWGWRQFARKILDLRAPPTWEPGFDFMVPGQEELAMQFCLEIAGPRGKKGSPPDPVRLMEMAQALYKAEADARPKET